MKLFMVVDDAPIIRKVAKRILDDMGFAVAEAEDGVDALEKCDHAMPDYILVDSDMPRMDGLELIQNLRRRKKAQNTTILYCVSELNVPMMMKAKRAGCQGFVFKPFTREILQEKLSEVGIYALAA